MFTKKSIISMFAVLLIVLMMSGSTLARPLEAPLGTGFTYQGKLTDEGVPANGAYDFDFTLYDALNDGSQVVRPVALDDVAVTAGLFTVQLDFGDVFDGTPLYLEIGVRPGIETGKYTTLKPRQALTATPFANYASKAPWSGLTGVPAGFSDGVDNDTTYTAGDGLALVGNEFSVTGAPWSGLTGVPAGFADGTDNNTLYHAGSGLVLVGNEFSVTGAPWSGLTGVPAGFADGVDDNTTYTAGDGLELVGTQFKGKGTSTQNVVIVAKSGGDYTTITAALASITTASNTNRYLIYIAPGVYDEQVTMKQYVDIEGAGELTTRITFTGSNSNTTGTVVGANNAELRYLTVENTGRNNYAIAIFNYSTSPRLTHVTASASGGSGNYGVYNDSSSSPMMIDVTASASGTNSNFGVVNHSSSPTMTNVSVSASGGTYNRGVENYSSSPTMTNVSVSASGGVDSYGVVNSSSSPTINNSVIIGSGGTNNYGIYNSYSSPTMTNVSANASGGTNSYGMYNESSSPTVNYSVISASGGTNNFGIYNFSAFVPQTVLVNNSQIIGSTSTIRLDSGFTIRIGASQLNGGAMVASGPPAWTCAGVYDENYTFYASTCP